MKKIIFILALALSINAYAQDNKTVTLVVSGQGKTQDEAKQNALRSAIEQAFGTFISSKTEILNDELVKDEIVSVANGNIQKFDVISDIQLSNGDFKTSLKATVSVTKLTNFITSKGIEHELKGELFVFNVNQKKLNSKNEITAFENLNQSIEELLKNCFEYDLSVSEPTADPRNPNNYIIPIGITIKSTSNINNYKTSLFNTIKALSLNETEVLEYHKIGLKTYIITIAIDEKNSGQFHLRSLESISKVFNMIVKLRDELLNFQISSGIDNNQLGQSHSLSDIEVQDIQFRPYLRTGNDGGGCGICYQSLFNSNSCRDVQQGYPPFRPIWNGTGMTYTDLEVKTYSHSSCYSSYFNVADKLKGYSFLKKYMSKNYKGYYEPVNWGFVISLVNLKPQNSIVQFTMNDNRKLEELKKIRKYGITKKS